MLNHIADDLRLAGEIHFSFCTGEVSLDGLNTDIQFRGDFASTLPFPDQDEHLVLAVGEPLVR